MGDMGKWKEIQKEIENLENQICELEATRRLPGKGHGSEGVKLFENLKKAHFELRQKRIELDKLRGAEHRRQHRADVARRLESAGPLIEKFNHHAAEWCCTLEALRATVGDILDTEPEHREFLSYWKPVVERRGERVLVTAVRR